MKITLRFLYSSFLFVCLTVLNSTEILAQTQITPVSEIAINTSEKKEIVVPIEDNKISPRVELTKNSSAFEYSAALARVGVQTSRSLPISLNEAIRKALENNNDIEVARTDVRFQ